MTARTALLLTLVDANTLHRSRTLIPVLANVHATAPADATAPAMPAPFSDADLDWFRRPIR